MGTRHPPPRAARHLRSAVMAIRVSRSSSGCKAAWIAPSPALHSIASAPWPGAGHSTSGANRSRITAVFCKRSSPAAARMMASALPCAELGQPGVYVAAKLNVLEIRPTRAQLGLAAQAAGAHHRSCRQRIESAVALRHQYVAGSARFGIAASVNCLAQLGGQIFQAMHRQVDRSPPAKHLQSPW